MSERSYDVVLWGATGFTGQLVADYLASVEPLRWAIAGRNRDKLDGISDRLGGIDIVVADAADAASLRALAEQTRVVCTTVGPYAQYGSALVAACVEAGTHYCDLTGEVDWIREMIDTHHEAASRAGTRIVHCCGFDSIPSDLGVLMVFEAMTERGETLARVDSFFGESKGGFSGGTIASLFGVVDRARSNRDTRRVLGDPYGLDPEPRTGGPDGSDEKGIKYEKRLGRWTAPFVMAAINTRIVRRSNALADYAYGREFRYTERMSVPGGVRGFATAAAISGGLAGFVVATQVPLLRRMLEKKLPGPGEGPSERTREAGFFVLRLIGESDGESPTRMFGRVGDSRDPGYGSTAVMLSESALCLAFDDLDTPGGVLTPATAMGAHLIERLRDAGMTWETSTSEI